jgi:hypothetical protein
LKSRVEKERGEPAPFGPSWPDGTKGKNVSLEHETKFRFGDVWTWTAMDVDTKLVPS